MKIEFFIEDHVEAIELLGYIPMFLTEKDSRPAREQFNERYRHGGGWNPLPGFTMNEEVLFYPGDPPLYPIARITLNNEKILMYRHAWVAIVQPDGSFEVARMD